MRILNGTVVLQYVSVPRGHIPDHKQEGSRRGQKRAGRAGSGPKVAVLCRAVNKKWVTFEGGSRRGLEEGPRNRTGKASTNRSKTKSERTTLSERMMTKSVKK